MTTNHKTCSKLAITLLILGLYWFAGYFPFIPNSTQIGLDGIASKFAQGRVCLIPFKHFQLDSVIDWAINLIGFIPLGYLLVAMWEKVQSILYATILCSLLSLSIEMGQLFLAVRITSTEDLIFNTLGGLIGVWIAKTTQAQWGRRGRDRPLGGAKAERE